MKRAFLVKLFFLEMLVNVTFWKRIGLCEVMKGYVNFYEETSIHTSPVLKQYSLELWKNILFLSLLGPFK